MIKKLAGSTPAGGSRGLKNPHHALKTRRWCGRKNG